MNIRNSSGKQEEYVPNGGRTDYVVPKSRRANIIAYILSLIAAVALWGYISMNEQADITQKFFNAMTLEFDGENELKNQYGLIVQSVSEEQFSITLTGNSEDLQKVSGSDIRLYVDLSEQNIDSAGTFELTVHTEIPEGFEAVLSTEKIKVTIDKPDTRVFEVGSENIQLMGWIKESGCTVAGQTVNVSKVTLEGNSTNLQRVAGVEIRTDAIGMISSSDIIVSAGVYLLDEAGNLLDLPITVRTDALQGRIEVSLRVEKEATLELSVEQINGYLQGEGVVTVSPASVRVTGGLEQVNKLLQSGSLPLVLPAADFVTDGKLDGRKLLNDQELTGLQYELPAGVEGIEVTLEDGTPFTGATLTVAVSEIRSETVVLPNFTLSDPQHFAPTQEEGLSVTFRSTGDDAVFEEFLSSLSHVTLYVDTGSYDPETGTAAVEVRISSAYSGAAYALGEYRVGLMEITPPGTEPDSEPADGLESL